MKIRLLITLFSLSLLLSAPSLVRIPIVLPFLDVDVRAAAPAMLQTLREKGLWLVNVDMKSITKDTKGICFTFEHRYTGTSRHYSTELITTCTHD